MFDANVQDKMLFVITNNYTILKTAYTTVVKKLVFPVLGELTQMCFIC